MNIGLNIKPTLKKKQSTITHINPAPRKSHLDLIHGFWTFLQKDQAVHREVHHHLIHLWFQWDSTSRRQVTLPGWLKSNTLVIVGGWSPV